MTSTEHVITIDPALWERGLGGGYLFNPDTGCSCVIGIALIQCGVPPEALEGQGEVGDVRCADNAPELPAWASQQAELDWICDVMGINDDTLIPLTPEGDRQRIEKINQESEPYGVRFVLQEKADGNS